MVDYVCRENLDFLLVSDLLGLGCDLNIERQDCRVFLFDLVIQLGCAGLHHVLFVDWTDTHCRHWNLHLLKVLEQSFERADS